jgi:hypothetical protein
VAASAGAVDPKSVRITISYKNIKEFIMHLIAGMIKGI